MKLHRIVANSLNVTKPKHYHSQPMSTEYSKPFQYSLGHAQPSIMQEAFEKALKRISNEN